MFGVVRQLLRVENVVRVPVAPAAGAAEHVPREVIVRYAPVARAASAASAEVVAPRTRVVKTRRGQSVAEKAAALRRRPGVLSATPNYVARASYIPNDPGVGTTPAGWQTVQWNFVGPFGVNAPAAWDHVAEVGRTGATGVIVAVLDTGVAYSDRGRFRR